MYYKYKDSQFNISLQSITDCEQNLVFAMFVKNA